MSPKKTSEQIRAEFFDFFREKDHEIVSSASLVPDNDPTLLFTNAGMNQFKDVFLGTGERPYKRAADTQKCLRVSGKHNDLEEVGIDTYHHTFFEMLGNWSFGDYFKQEAIGWAWELLVDRWGLDPSRLYATVHEGDEALGLGADEEAAGFWKSETTIDPDNVLFCGSKDNFWMMGDTGPCGPCSEIHIDLRSDEERSKVPGSTLVNADDPRVMEIWNLVFIQYDAKRDGSLEPLPAQHVDTGMGFERLVAVLQDKRSNYDTDLFGPLLSKIAELTPRSDINSYSLIDVEGAEQEKVKIAMRVIADHARAITFTIADGVMPGNVGRGYVIRRILRRAVRFGYQTLELREPFLHRLVATIGEQMSDVFPEVGNRKEYVEQIVRAEEESFLNTLGTGLSFFDRIVPFVKSFAAGDGDVESLRKELEEDRRTTDLLEKSFVQADSRADMMRRFEEVASRGVLPGEIAFLLHDTYGFPVDLTQLMAREEGLGVDMDAYQELMRQQKDRARSAATFIADDEDDESWHEISSGGRSEFVGYDRTAIDDARIRKVRKVHDSDGGEVLEVVLDRTPFYAESGGQVGDVGHLRIGDHAIAVTDTRRVDEEIVHFVEDLPGDLDGPVVAEVDSGRRTRIMKHHTATHLLHAALREVLGPHVAQK
ncbi:MAG: alanine--tRNA ligase, partial [Rhodothermia bacterium]|nr:alanine--tRNA ligase [Rhodothermia bacterium]